jgi:hypothetical protein
MMLAARMYGWAGAGYDLEGAARHFAGFAQTPHLGEHDAEVGKSELVFGGDVDGFLELFGGLGESSHGSLRGAEFVVSIDELGVERDRLAVKVEGLRDVVFGEELLTFIELLGLQVGTSWRSSPIETNSRWNACSSRLSGRRMLSVWLPLLRETVSW